MSYFSDVLAMHQKFGFPRTGDGEGGPRLLPDDLQDLAFKHLDEEVEEFKAACRRGDLPEVADALVDIVVVALGRAAMMRLDFDAHWAEVYRALQQKVRVKDESESKRGHALDLRKPEGWEPPNHVHVLDESRADVTLIPVAELSKTPFLKKFLREKKWDCRLVRLAREVASWSKDPTTKVGCAIQGVEPNYIAVGYNGFPPGVNDAPERLADRETKHLLTQHAERNALDNATFVTRGATMATTFFPCVECAKSIVSKGIACVVVAESGRAVQEPWISSAMSAREILTEAGVEIRFANA